MLAGDMFLPADVDDELLLAVDDRDVAVRVDRRDVAGVHPASGERLRGLLRARCGSRASRSARGTSSSPSSASRSSTPGMAGPTVPTRMPLGRVDRRAARQLRHAPQLADRQPERERRIRAPRRGSAPRPRPATAPGRGRASPAPPPRASSLSAAGSPTPAASRPALSFSHTRGTPPHTVGRVSGRAAATALHVVDERRSGGRSPSPGSATASGRRCGRRGGRRCRGPRRRTGRTAAVAVTWASRFACVSSTPLAAPSCPR